MRDLRHQSSELTLQAYEPWRSLPCLKVTSELLGIDVKVTLAFIRHHQLRMESFTLSLARFPPHPTFRALSVGVFLRAR